MTRNAHQNELGNLNDPMSQNKGLGATVGGTVYRPSTMDSPSPERLSRESLSAPGISPPTLSDSPGTPSMPSCPRRQGTKALAVFRKGVA